jgi:hypothetical protein
VIIFAYGIVKCLLDKTFKTILRIFYQYRPRFHTETRRALTFVELPLYIEQKKQDAINDYNQFCDRVGQQAQEQGLTEEKLAALLAHE